MPSVNEQRELEEFARGLAHAVNEAVKERWDKRVFWNVLIGTFAGGDDGFMTYVSNADRADMVQTLRELASKVELENRKVPREYVKEVEPEIRFTSEVIKPEPNRRLQIEELDNAQLVLVKANGRSAGVLQLTEVEARELTRKLYTTEPDSR